MSWLETRRLPLFFVAATLLPIAVLGWLGVHTLGQDRDAARVTAENFNYWMCSPSMRI